MESKLREWRRSCRKHGERVKTTCIGRDWHVTCLGVGVDLEGVDGDVKGRDLGDVVVLALALLLLELEGNATDGALLNSLHEMSREAGDLVSQSL